MEEEERGVKRSRNEENASNSQEHSLNYVRFNEKGNPMSQTDTTKLVQLYHRVHDVAPWLYYSSERVQAKQEEQK
jgi:hypothetical protein